MKKYISRTLPAGMLLSLYMSIERTSTTFPEKKNLLSKAKLLATAVLFFFATEAHGQHVKFEKADKKPPLENLISRERVSEILSTAPDTTEKRRDHFEFNGPKGKQYTARIDFGTKQIKISDGTMTVSFDAEGNLLQGLLLEGDVEYNLLYSDKKNKIVGNEFNLKGTDGTPSTEISRTQIEESLLPEFANFVDDATTAFTIYLESQK